MPNVVFDASSIVGALLKEGSVSERALLLARLQDVVCLTASVEAEIREAIEGASRRCSLPPPPAALTPSRRPAW